jgi:hypothetical protein
MKVLTFAIAVAAITPAFAGEKIAVSAISESAYEIWLTSDHELSTAEAQAQLAATAARACGNRPVTLGHYSFESSKKLGTADKGAGASLLFIQKLVCAATPQEQTLSATPQPGAADTALIESTARVTSDRYFADLASKRYSSAFALLTNEMQAERPLEEWKSAQESFRLKAGERISGGVSRVTVYVDPPSAPKPGLYVATDYEFSYRNIPFQCGYIIWYRHGADEFRLLREETGYIDSDTAAKLNKDEVQETRRQFGCVDL